ncbi:hypothetical protein G7Y89_g3605 [Cudoniella acicularis]|uniref:N-acetyltransferase domain-containing protein n=1 Tax=Cudoniella acicularis TaxID=354080 RepID=A0A8H4RR20_9HELO|nr:hypothetical protein G7Y89_g3605 [Cudoniella acicularis]
MSEESRKRRFTGLRTYSRRANTNTEVPLSKRRYVEETSDLEDSVSITLSPANKKRRVEEAPDLENSTPAISSPSPPQNIKRSSIQSYFKPLPRSSSPPRKAIIPSSDSIQLIESETPPSSPPARDLAPIPHAKKPQKRKPRRLISRPILPLNEYLTSHNIGSSIYDNDNDPDIKQSADLIRPPLATKGNPRRSAAVTTPSSSPSIGLRHGSFSSLDKEGAKIRTWKSGIIPTIPTKNAAKNPENIDQSDKNDHTPQSAPINVPKPKQAPRSITYQQTQIDLGQDTIIMCQICSMQYNSAALLDRREHARYCNSRRSIIFPREWMENRNFLRMDYSIDGHLHQIRVYSHASSNDERTHAENILESSRSDLGGPPRYSSDELWTVYQTPFFPGGPVVGPRFKLYIYYVGQAPVGMLLVEINTNDGFFAKTKNRSNGPQKLVFDRLWVGEKHRRNGYARQLADVARENFIPGMVVEKYSKSHLVLALLSVVSNMSADFPSSNPFRRKGPSTFTSAFPESPSEPVAYQEADPPPRSTTLEAVDAPKKITKKVRVQSPPPPSPSIPDSASTIEEDAFLTATKLPTTIPFKDPFDNISSDVSDNESSTRKNRVPANPFSKTLETMEHPEREREAPVAPSGILTSPGRASLDVEAFKRLLMTGNSGLSTPIPPPPIPAHAALHTLGDGGSSTDTSSVSRQSIFEAIQEVHPESPRSSHEISEPEDERRGLVTESHSTSNRKAPPPPNSRHGKLIRVELRDDPPTTLNSPPTPSSTTQNYFASSPVPLNRSQTDLNKPLPPAPNRASHDSDRESVFDKEAAGKTPEPPSPSASIRRKTPPAPPITRRRSQKVVESRNRSNSGRLSPKVEEDAAPSPEIESGRPRSNSSRAPPPPPSRRPASIRGSSHHLPLSPPSSISLPAPPPARGSTRQSSTGRPPSVISLDISTNNKRASVIPPPPPPHRQRNSIDAQSPGESRRTSGEQSRRSIESGMWGWEDFNVTNQDLEVDGES